MKLIPKSYYHSRTVLALLSMNAAMLVLTLFLTLQIDGENPRAVIQYRAGLLDSITRGETSYLYSFALYAVIVTVISTVLSVRLFTHRHRLAVSVLGGNLILLLLTIVVFNALSGVQ